MRLRFAQPMFSSRAKVTRLAAPSPTTVRENLNATKDHRKIFPNALPILFPKSFDQSRWFCQSGFSSSP